jgi:hypothetical protein
LRIVGRSLTPGATLDRVQMGARILSILQGSLTVNGDSVLDVVCEAPRDAAEGSYPMWAYLNSQPNLITLSWQHADRPHPQFRLLRAEQDTFAFVADTLEILLHGVQTGESANVQAGGVTLPWIGTAPVADSLNRISGFVTIPDGMAAGDHILTASVPGLPDAEADYRLKVRYFCRYEVEAMPRSAYQGSRDKILSVLDFIQPGSDEPWGRNLARRLTGNQVGDQITVNFTVPATGFYQLNYFLGRTGYGVITAISVDGQGDIAPFDTYDSQLDWRWSRTDTLSGQWRNLSAGSHSVRFEITGRNLQNTAHWDLVMDQILVRQPQDSLDWADAVTVLPDKYELNPCFPNPFNPATTVSFSVPKQSDVEVSVYNVLGRRVAVLANKQFEAGQHLLHWQCDECASGIYLIRMKTRDVQILRKAVLMR